MPVTARDAQALTYLAQRLRDDTPGCGKWDENGTNAVISRLLGQNLALTVERVVRHACDATARTPGAIDRPFLPDLPAPGPRHPASVGQDCPAHPGEYADACRSCAADRLAGDPATTRTRSAADPSAHAARIRARLHPEEDDQ